MVGYDASKERQLSPFWLGTAGVLSGMLTRFITQPLDVLKIRFQLQLEPLEKAQRNYYWNMRQASGRIWKEETFRGLWKGHVPAQLLSAVYGLAQFGTFEVLTKLVHVHVTEEARVPVNLLCGSLSGAAGTVLSMPCDTVRTRLVGQGEPKLYKGAVHACMTMLRNEGFLSLYKGLVPSLVQIMPQTGVQFACFRLFTETYWNVTKQQRDVKLPVGGNLVCGSLAGLVAKVLVYPLDLSKKRLQVQGFEEARVQFGKVTKYSGLWNCLGRTLLEEGLRGMYKGLAPSLIKAMTSTALTFTFYEEIVQAFYQLKLS